MLRWAFYLIAFSCLWRPTVQSCTDCWFPYGSFILDPIDTDPSEYHIFYVNGYDCSIAPTYRWAVKSMLHEVIRPIVRTTEPYLKVSSFYFQYDRLLLYNNLIIEVTKEDFYGSSTCQCFIRLINLHIYAEISGGSSRLISRLQRFKLDAKASYDETQLPGNQRIIYLWECKSHTDPFNPFCSQMRFTSQTIEIPEDVLEYPHTYIFSLLIESEVSGNQAYDAHNVTVGGGTYFPIAGVCYQNCRARMYNLGINVHYKFYCDECPRHMWFEYFVDDVRWKRKTRSNALLFMPPDKANITVKAILYSRGRNSTMLIKMTKNVPPAGGSCSVKPTSGTAVATNFIIKCDGYTDVNMPIKYKLTAGNMLYDKKAWAYWHTHLPVVTTINIQICDSYEGCTEVHMPVEVKPIEIPTDLPHLEIMLKNDSFNIEKKLRNGDFTSAVVIGSVMIKQSKETQAFEKILSGFNKFNVTTMHQVRQLTTMTSELTEPLKPLNSEKAEIVGKLFTKITDGFEAIIKDGEIAHMDEKDYDMLSGEMIGMIEEFSKKAEDFPDIRSMMWEYESHSKQLADAVAAETPPRQHLVERYGKLDNFNETVLEKINRWQHVICKGFEVLHDIGVAGANALLSKEEDHVVDGLSKEVRMVTFRVDEVEQNITLVSLDALSTVMLSVNVLNEMAREIVGPDTLLQMVSFKQNPFWWYPHEHPITTSIFYFSAFSKVELENRRTDLEEPIIIKMQQTSTPTDPIIHRGTLNNASQMIMYQSHMQPGAGYRVLLVELSASAHVRLLCGIRPTVSQVRSAKLLAANESVYLVNKQENEINCYVAIMADKAATGNVTYGFHVRIYECLTWRVKRTSPTWSTDGCEAYVDLADTDNITCHCYHLSIFAGRTHYAYFEETVRDRNIMQELPTNWYMVLFYIILILLLALLLLKAYCDLTNTSNVLVTDLAAADKDQPYTIMLYITTGAQWTAGTTANVFITFATGLIGTTTFTIYQDPGKPQLVPGSTCELKLPTRVKDLRKPLHLTLSHDNKGRYPSWYCHTIRLKDLESGEEYEFPVKRWISTKTVNVKVAPQAESKKMTNAEKRKTFCKYFGEFFALFFLFHPLFGPWRSANIALDRFERTCIWCTKFAVMLLIIVLCFGGMELDDYENEREWYEFILTRLYNGLLLCLGCYFAGVLVELLIFAFLYPCKVENYPQKITTFYKDQKEAWKRKKEDRKFAKQEKKAQQKKPKQEKSEKKKMDKERAEREKAEKQNEKLAKAREQKEKAEREKTEKANKQKAEKEKVEREKAKKERAEKEKAYKEREEMEKTKREKADEEKDEKVKAESDKGEE